MKRRINIGLLACLSLGLGTECHQNTASQETTEKDTIVTTAEEDHEPLIAEAITQQGPVEILLPTQYRKESGYPNIVDATDWYALYLNKETNQWQLEKKALEISYDVDPCTGDSILVVEPFKEAILFINGVENLQIAPETILTDRMLLPERNVAFQLNGNDYTLLPMGRSIDENGNDVSAEEQKAKSEADVMYNAIEAYQLSISTGTGSPMMIATQDEIKSDGRTPKLLWAGDLNGDGLPDVIVDIADWYESQQILFFLSDKNDQEHFLRKVAEIMVSNDC